MQVKLITTIETIIDISRERYVTLDDSKREILGGFLENACDEIAAEIKDAHQSAVFYDSVRTQIVTHSFEEVK